MEFFIQKNALVAELQIAQGVIERKNSIPILAHVLVEAEGDRIRFAATDMDLTVRGSCEARVISEGAITLSARKLYDIARVLPESEVHVAGDPEGWARIHCDRVSYRVAGMARDEFPELPQPGKGKEQKLPAEVLRALIERTGFAVSVEDSRYFLAGALLAIEADAVAMAATDGHRLAYARKAVSVKGNEPQKILVPRKAVNELAHLLDGGEQVGFRKGENHLFFDIGSRSLSSKLVEGQFPAYEKVISVGGDKSVLVERELLAMAVRRVVLVSAERNRAVKVELSAGKIDLSSSSPELGEAQETLPVDYSGETVSVVFNGQYLLDFLGVVGTAKVLLELKDGDSQGMLRPAESEDIDYRYIVMPMRL